ncbi:MAG: acetylxylan esterase [Clostridiaceae bacterium]|nr:acetylxylan esterase [Clostridiaceae bacterium]
MPLEQLKEYMGVSPKADDFDAFWDDAVATIPEHGADYILEKSEFQVAGVTCYHLYFRAEDGSRVHALFSRPEKIEGASPAIIKFHGYSGASGGFHEIITYSLLGYTVLYLDCRGQGGISEDLAQTKGSTYFGLIIRGLEEGPHKLYFKKVFLDTVRCARILLNMEGVSHCVGVVGGSQGGALALACAALEPRIKFALVSAPFLCDFKRIIDLGLMQNAYQEFGWHFRIRDPRHERQDEFLNVLSYIDVVNLAPRIRAEVFWKIGLMDVTCPPSTQFAAYNQLKSAKTMRIYPEYEHDIVGRYSDEELEFIIMHCKG